MSTKRDYLQGILVATVAVAEVTGKIKIGDMTDQTWRVINEINEKLLSLAASEADRLDGHSRS
jgi:uncharacterized protein YaaR (DUF327 family)